jgi:anti-sigma factor RsiW
MNHTEIKQKLFALYDGPLTEKERVLVEVHLSACPECRRAVGEWENISGALFTRPSFSEAAEDRMVARVMERIKPAPAPWLPWKSDLKWFMPLLGSALAAAWVFFLVLPNSPEILQQPLTMSLLNAVHVQASLSQAPKKTARVTRPIPSFVFSPIRQTANATPVQLYVPIRPPSDTPADPFVQAVVYHY